MKKFCIFLSLIFIGLFLSGCVGMEALSHMLEEPEAEYPSDLIIIPEEDNSKEIIYEIHDETELDTHIPVSETWQGIKLNLIAFEKDLPVEVRFIFSPKGGLKAMVQLSGITLFEVGNSF